MKKLLFITGSRGEYGYVKPIIKEIQKNNDFTFDILVTNMHLISSFGNTLEEFQKDGIPVKYKIYNTLDSYNKITTIKSLALFLLQLPEVIDDSKPDIILISGDRGEQLMGALAGIHMNIPVAHIQAGELSGHIDGVIRHSITKLSTIHFSSNRDAYNRVINLGENKDNVFNVGAPQIDDMLDIDKLDPNIKSKYGLNRNKMLFLVVNHPVHEEENTSENICQIMDSIFSLKEYENDELEILVVLPNSDSNTSEILLVYEEIKKNYNNIKFIPSLPRLDYLSLLYKCNLLVGNSSSGILEAATYKKPVVNIGKRQNHRLQSKNIINVKDYNLSLIKQAILKGISYNFLEEIKDVKNLYGTVKATPKILEVLNNLDLNKLNIIKEITF